MKNRSASKALRAYPRAWRKAHGEAVLGMIRESAAEYPQAVEKERRAIILRGLAVRLRWAPSYFFGVSAAVVAAFAVGIMATSFTEQNELLIQTLLFGVVPVLSLWAISASAGASPSIAGISKFTVVTASLGFAAASVAHISWYSALGNDDSGGVELTAWFALVAAAVVLFGMSIAKVIWPTVSRSMPTPPATLVVILAGFTGAVGIVAISAIPGTAPILAVLALGAVVIRHRRSSRRSHESRATA